MHSVDGGNVEPAKPVAALHARTQRDMCVVADEAQTNTRPEAQMAIIRAKQDFGCQAARVDGLLEHRVFAREQPAAIGRQQRGRRATQRRGA